MIQLSIFNKKSINDVLIVDKSIIVFQRLTQAASHYAPTIRFLQRLMERYQIHIILIIIMTTAVCSKIDGAFYFNSLRWN